MSIHIVYGKPGSGKSLYGTGHIIRELRESRRIIVTNFPLQIERLNEYLQEKFPDESIDLRGRLIILDDENLRRFFLWRGPSVVSALGLPPPRPRITEDMSDAEVEHTMKSHTEALDAYRAIEKKAQGDIGKMIATADTEAPHLGADRGRGVAFFLDEAQIPFNAKDWSGEDMRPVFEYLTQHRKLGDDVWAFTQAPGNLDKQFRSLAQDFRRCENHRLKQLGVFRGMDKFKCHHFEFESNRKSDAYRVEEYRLDPKGIASCYDTARGIGVQGSGADKGARAKGITIGWGVVGLFALASLVFVIPWGLGKATQAYMGKKEPIVLPSEAKKGESVDTPKKALNLPAAEDSPLSGQPGSPGELLDQVRVRGYTIAGKKVTVVLTDGRTFNETDDELEKIGRGYVVISGRKYRLAQPGPGTALKPRETSIPAQTAGDLASPAPSSTTVSESSWIQGSDGVLRLAKPETLSGVFGVSR